MVGNSAREMSERWFNRLIVGGVTLGFLALLAASLGALVTVQENQRLTLWVNHTYRVERLLSRFRVSLERAESARRGLLLSDNPQIRSNFLGAVGQLRPMLDGMARLTGDNPRQQANIAATRRTLSTEIGLLQQSFAFAERGQREAGVLAFRQAQDSGLVRTLWAETDRMLAEEEGLLRQRSAAQQASLGRFRLILAFSGVLLVLVALSTVWLILRYTRDLQASRNELRGLNEDLEGAVTVRTTDLRRANDEIQRFAYIVSHDLRSPLVNVMGFTAELEAATGSLRKLVDQVDSEAPGLVSADARAAAQEDLPEAIGFIRTSTQKMDRLINAILRLSREGRRPITPELLDMGRLVQGITDSLKHRSDELGVTITVAPGLPAITSDRLAVEQILSNIVENALKYLQPGRPGLIEIGARRAGPRVTFSVADNGRGIDLRDHDRIFDLFRRSGVQDQPGEGIGLAHTRALAYRLGGSISVESRLGEGATFLISLPVTYAGDQGALS